MPKAKPTPHVLFLDLGNVVIHWSAERLVRNLAAHCPLSVGEVADRLWNSTLDPAYVEGRLSTAEFRSGMAETLGASWTDAEFAHAWNDVFERVPAMEALVTQVAARLPTYALTNTNDLHFEWLREGLPVFDTFRALIASHEVGAQKPDPRIFAAACDAANCVPEEALFVDDLQPNVDGARAHGLHAVRFQHAPALRGELIRRGVDLPPAP
jgi:HAD superfamily hydrolase (TIGR01509 family)